jgi:hypothetical protein
MAPASAIRVKVRTPAAARRGPCPLLRSRSMPISSPTASAALDYPDLFTWRDKFAFIFLGTDFYGNHSG